MTTGPGTVTAMATLPGFPAPTAAPTHVDAPASSVPRPAAPTVPAAGTSALVDADDLTRLEQLADAGPPGTLVVVTAPAADVAASAAERLASRWAGPGDLRVAAPDGDRWTVDALDATVIAPSRLVPSYRNVIVVHHAAAMTAQAADHLLKTLEEPGAPTTFLFAIADTDTLSATIRSRAAVTLALRLAPAAARTDALVAAGIDRETATRAVTACGPEAALAVTVAADLPALALLEAALAAPTASPVAAARARLERIEQLAKATGPKATEKARVRQVARLALAAADRRIAAAARANGTDTTAVHQAAQSGRTLARARQALDRYAPPLLVLTAAALAEADASAR